MTDRPRDTESYYGRPIIKPPVWKQEIAWYLFTGGWRAARRRSPWRPGSPATARLARTAIVVAAAGSASARRC